MARTMSLICLALCVSYAIAGICFFDSQCNRNTEECENHQCQRKNNNARNQGCPNGWRPSQPSRCNSENDCQRTPCRSACERDRNFSQRKCDECNQKYDCKRGYCCFNN